MHNDRRDFLKTAGALVVGFSRGSALAKAARWRWRRPRPSTKEALDAWLAIGRDNRITVHSGKVDSAPARAPRYSADRRRGARRRLRARPHGDGRHNGPRPTSGSPAPTHHRAGGMELRRAAASARLRLCGTRAAQRPVHQAASSSSTTAWCVSGRPSRRVAYGELIDSGFSVKVDPKVATKKHTDYKLIGRNVPRVDIPGKVTGESGPSARLPPAGMLHARVIRPQIFGAAVSPGRRQRHEEGVGLMPNSERAISPRRGRQNRMGRPVKAARPLRFNGRRCDAAEKRTRVPEPGGSARSPEGSHAEGR